ncbi:MAG TPA: triose-phosphate isomerase [Chitinophagales bacterium]|nr:triose-phosphate isomerase [Chitinophagales bacterium]
MRKKIVAGNWKMNKTITESSKLAEETLQLLTNEKIGDTVVVFCPSFVSLEKVSSIIKGKKNIYTSAQNCHSEKSGAYTGEISVSMIKDAGASYVIIGHSERREYFGETNEELSMKVDAALAVGLAPIYCCGEQLDVRENGTYTQLVEQQIRQGLFHLSAGQFQNVVIAYEPVWAIGTGKVATDEQAQDMHAYIRHLIALKYGHGVSDEITILYGGSCKPSNAKGLFSQKDVDGGLIGGASLVASDFVGIIRGF